MHSSGTWLELLFLDAQGNDVYFCFPYASPSASAYYVKNLAKDIINNGNLFLHVPVTFVKAQLFTISNRGFDIDIDE